MTGGVVERLLFVFLDPYLILFLVPFPLHSAAKFDPSRITPVLLPIGMFIFILSEELIW